MLALVLACAAGVVTALPAAAQTRESWPVPRSGTFELAGRGYGHGIGLSQWGALGAAVRGLTASQILDYYYPGTVPEARPPSLVRVWVTSDNDGDLRFAAAPGLSVSGAGQSLRLPTSVGAIPVAEWRVSRTTRLGLRYRSAGGSWTTFTVPAAMAAASSWDVTANSGSVRAVLPTGVHREYAGSLRAAIVSSGLRTVVVSDLDTYVRSVIPAEMPSSWPAEALRAQAVAARTHAAADRQRASTSAVYDTCDSTSCQVFAGVADYRADGSLIRRYWTTPTDRAVADTAGVLRVYGGQPARTQFSASSGGWTAAGSAVYLPAQPDPYDSAAPGAPTLWRASITAAEIEQKWPSIGQLQSIDVVGRTGDGAWGGRTLSVGLRGTLASLLVPASTFRTVFGLRSTWWIPTNTARRAADWNQDGPSDLLARDAVGRLWLYPGSGSGRFAPKEQIGQGWSIATAVVLPGDLDGDTAPDLLARFADGTLRLYPGNGSGGFLPPRQIGAGWNVMRTILGPGDWNGDGHTDLLGERRDGLLYLYPGTGDGRFGRTVQIGRGWSTMTAIVAVGDWQKDGVPDLLARDAVGRLWLYPGRGTGRFAARQQVGNGWNIMTSVHGAGDWDRDGAADVTAIDASGRLWLYPGTRSGGLGRPVAIGTGWGFLTGVYS